jgi:hypothetical protein
MVQVMQSIGDVLSMDEAQEMIEQADADGDGCVNYEEFVGLIFRGVRDRARARIHMDHMLQIIMSHMLHKVVCTICYTL